jgi:hypothetical protein
MKSIFHTLVVLFIASQAFAQKHWVAEDGVDHPIDALTAQVTWGTDHWPTDTARIREKLMEVVPALSTTGSGLRLAAHISSPGGEHFRYVQTLNGREVYRGAVKVNLTRSGRMLSLADHTLPTDKVSDTFFPPHGPYHQGLLEHYSYPPNGKLEKYTLDEVFFQDENGNMLPCIRLAVLDGLGRAYEMILNKEVRVVYQNDLLAYASAPLAPIDTLVSMSVFMPDPLTTAGLQYGSPFVDNNDQDVAQINAERVTAQARVTFDNGIFSLEGPYAKIEDTSSPTVVPATSTTDVFTFNRSQDGFEDINAYYHITAFQAYIQSLGFNNLVNYPISIDTHALSGSDNSNFNPASSPPRLSFGEGGVDDAEDADVIIHEYGHAIMHSAAPGTNNGTERKALDEAVGDYFASSYSRALNPFGWDRVFSWDGHNEFWAGRSTISTDHYPEDLNMNLYSDADIWSATLMQIWGDIGREVTDAIMMQAAFSFFEGMSMSQAAVIFIQADTVLFGGSHFTPIRQRMYDRGLIPWNVDVAQTVDRPYQVLGMSGYAAGTDDLVIRLADSKAGRFDVIDALGRTVASDLFSGSEVRVPPATCKGAHIIRISTTEGIWSVRAVGL